MMLKMKHDVKAYVKTCLLCQQDKSETKKNAKLLQSLPILKRPFKFISIHVIIGLSKIDGMQSVLMIMDKFSKYVVCITAPNACTTYFIARLFHKHYMKYIGVPKDIINNKDARFIKQF